MTEYEGSEGTEIPVALNACLISQPTFESKFIDFVFSSPAMVAEIEKRIVTAKPNETLENQLHAILDGQRSEMFALLHKWIGVEGIIEELFEDGADADKIIVTIFDSGQSVDTEAILSSLDSDEILDWVSDNLKSELEDWVNNNGEIRSFEIRL
jgi:hypothetical protein